MTSLASDSLAPRNSRRTHRHLCICYVLAPLMLLLVTASAAHAATVTATWNANPESDIAGYKLSYGIASGAYTTTIDVGNVTTYALTLLGGQTYYFAVQAYDTSGLVSTFSTEVAFTVPAGTTPTILSLSPSTGPAGTAVTIAGGNFGATQSTSTVTFNGATATSSSWSASSIVVSVPAAATSGNVVVTVGGVASNGSPFVVNAPPTLAAIANQSNAENTAVSLQLVGSDPNGNPVTYSATNLPAGVAINGTTGLISGTLTFTSAGTYTVTATVSDGSLTASRTFTWTVSNVNAPPVLVNPGNQSGVLGGTVSLALSASDPDGTALTYSATGLPTGLSINSTTGLITGTLPNAAGSFAVTATVSDGTLTNSQSFTWTVAAQVITFVQQAYAAPSSGTTVAVALSGAQGVGDLNVVVVGWNDTTRTVQSVADTRGNTYVRAVGPTLLNTAATQSIYYAKNISAAAAGANTVTVTFSGAASFPDVRVAEYSGLDPTSPLDVVAGASGSSALANSGNATTTSANDLLVGADYTQGTTSGPGAGFTSRVITVPDSDILEDQVVASAGAYSATAPFATSTGWIMQMVAFHGAGTASATPTLTSLAPTSGPVGTSVTITGTNFGSTKGTSTVTFNAGRPQPRRRGDPRVSSFRFRPVRRRAMSSSPSVALRATRCHSHRGAGADNARTDRRTSGRGGDDYRNKFRQHQGHEHGDVQRHHRDADDLVGVEHRGRSTVGCNDR